MPTSLWKIVALAGWMLPLPGLAQAFHPPLSFLLGGDISMAPKLEEQGVVYKDGGQPKDIFAIFRDRGATCIRLRLFVQPDGKEGVVNDTAYTIALAKRVKAAGLLFSLDFHYSDTWADPGHQETPAAWRSLSFAQLVNQTRDYTEETLREFKDAGVTPDVVQIGNEITHGLLWPLGALDGKGGAEDAAFDRLAQLLRADAQGLHLALGDDTSTKIMIHIDGADATTTVKWFFDHIIARHVPFDMIGLSYYPTWGGNLSQVKETLAMAARSYRKPIVIAETAYPFTDTPGLEGRRKSFNWPLTPQGQRDYLEALLRTVRATPHGLGAGVLYWYPESVPPRNFANRMWNQGDEAMFDHDGNTLPVFDAFRAATAR